MKYDSYGQAHCSESELCDLLYQNPDLDISLILVDNPDTYNQSVKNLYAELPLLKAYVQPNINLEKFDFDNQQQWFMPLEYQNLDICEYLTSLCTTPVEFDRVEKELLLFQERNLFDLLRFLKYFVDVMRANNVVWGVGRGSSVSSYVLYLLGVHKINSIKFDLPIEEFLK